MRRARVLAVVLAVVVLGAPLAAGHLGGHDGALATTAGDGDGNASDGSVAPGAALAGVVAAGNASVTGAFEAAAFGVRYRAAPTDAARAGVLAGQSDSIDERIASLRDRQERLLAAHENGSISTGKYHAEAATIAAEIRSLQRIANATVDRADRLPAAALEAKGVDLAAVRDLAANARNLTGPEVARVARGLGAGAPGSPSAPGTVTDQQATAAVDRAADRIDAVRERLERHRNRLGEDALATAEGRLDRAERALADARTALENGDGAEAIALADEAEGHARVASTTFTGLGAGIGGTGPGGETDGGTEPGDGSDDTAPGDGTDATDGVGLS